MKSCDVEGSRSVQKALQILIGGRVAEGFSYIQIVYMPSSVKSNEFCKVAEGMRKPNCGGGELPGSSIIKYEENLENYNFSGIFSF